MPRVAAIRDQPSELWAALSPLLAGQKRIRISRDGGKSYPQRFERDLTDALPSHPAAVRIYGVDGACQALCLDFDSSVDGIDRVDADVRLTQELLYAAGARWVEDYSPNGGRHLYVPLADRVPFHDARDLVEALSLRFKSLDATPHQNLHHGCIRTPGSRHKSGGYQMLAMSLSMAYDVVRKPNPSPVLNELAGMLKRELHTVRSAREAASAVDMPAADPERAPAAGMSRTMLAIAVHGIYESTRYKSASEARQAVLLSAAGSALSLTDVERRMKQGAWPGLAQFYARYSPANRFKALKRDWSKALRFLQTTRSEPQDHNDRKSPTSQQSTQAPGTKGLNAPGTASEYQYLRTWQNALSLLENRYTGSRSGMARRMILRAMGAAANMSGNRFVEFGVRSLSLASGVDHTTVAAHLRALRAEREPLITLVEHGRGVRGDLYLLSVPERVLPQAEKKRWRAGKLHALRPAFRVLGMPAAFVYEALEHSPSPASTTDLVRLTGMSRTAVAEALEVLNAWCLVQRGDDRGWSIHTGTSLRVLAERLGVLDALATLIARHRAERLSWRVWLAKQGAGKEPVLPAPTDDYPWEEFEGPPDDWTLADIAFSSGLQPA